MNNYCIEVKNLSKYFGKEVVLRELNLNLKLGEALLITGANGVGKSTFLGILAGVLKANAGDAKYFSKYHLDMERDSFSRELIKKIAYQGQKSNLYSNLTIEENLELIAVCKKANFSDIEELLSQFNLNSFKKKKLQECSQGVQKKATIIRAFLGSPELILLDEPFANLDRDSVLTLKQILKVFKQQGKSIVVLSHDEEKEDNLFDAKLKLEKGKLI